MADTKRCSHCRELKEIDAFNCDRTRVDGVSPECRACRSARAARYYEQNKARVAARRAAFRQANPEVMRAHAVKYLASHADTHRAASKRWHDSNKEKVRERQRLARLTTPELSRATSAAFRARRAGAPGRGVTSAEWREMQGAALGICVYCSTPAPLTADHIEPLARGGAHEPENIAFCCRRCNGAKGDTPLLVWLALRRAA